MTFQGDLLERMCYKTEFEVEGWRKIPTLIKILHDNISTNIIARMKLQLLPTQIIEPEKIWAALKWLDPTKMVDKKNKQIRSIKDSWIYTHFKNCETKDVKIAIYVNALLPINQNLNDYNTIQSVVNHCVLAKGIQKWENENNEMVECLELEIYGGSNQDRFIPVECPFFEEVQIGIKKIFNRNEGSDARNRPLNKYGKQLAEMKWGKQFTRDLETEWFNVRKELRPGVQNDEEESSYKNLKYQMLFVRAIHPCYQLKFTA